MSFAIYRSYEMNCIVNVIGLERSYQTGYCFEKFYSGRSRGGLYDNRVFHQICKGSAFAKKPNKILIFSKSAQGKTIV